MPRTQPRARAHGPRAWTRLEPPRGAPPRPVRHAEAPPHPRTPRTATALLPSPARAMPPRRSPGRGPGRDAGRRNGARQGAAAGGATDAAGGVHPGGHRAGRAPGDARPAPATRSRHNPLPGPTGGRTPETRRDRLSRPTAGAGRTPGGPGGHRRGTRAAPEARGTPWSQGRAAGATRSGPGQDAPRHAGTAGRIGPREHRGRSGTGAAAGGENAPRHRAGPPHGSSSSSGSSRGTGHAPPNVAGCKAIVPADTPAGSGATQRPSASR